MSATLPDRQLNFDAFAEPAQGTLAELLAIRLQTRSAELTPLHLLLAIRQRFGQEADIALAPAMIRGQRPAELFESVATLLADESAEPLELVPLTPDLFSEELQSLVGELASHYPPERASQAGDLSRFLALLLRHLSQRDRGVLECFLDPSRLEPAGGPQGAGGPLFDEQGQIVPGRTTDDGRQLLEAALALAARTGHVACEPTHLLLACFDIRRDDFQTIFRVYGSGERLRDARDTLVLRLNKQFLSAAPLTLERQSFSKLSQLLLDRLATGAGTIDPPAVLLALLEGAGLDPNLNDALAGPPLKLKLSSAIVELRRIRQEHTDRPQVGSSRALPPPLSDAENLTQALRSLDSGRYVSRPESVLLEKHLSSRGTRVTLVHGESGVGRSALVEGLAQRAAAGEVSSLKDAVFLRFNAEKIDESARAVFFRRLIEAGRREPHCVLVIEGFHLLAAASPAQLRAVVTDSAAPRIIGITTTAEFSSQVAVDPDVAQRILAIPLRAPEFDEAVAMLDCAADRLEGEFDVTVARPELVNVVQLADRYLSAAPRPKRAVELLRWACDEARFVARQAGMPAVANFDAAATAIAERRQIPKEQILGTQGEEYFQGEMSRLVIGQPEAVAEAARCLQMALTAPPSDAQPVGVFLFAGQSGTGKTFLAQQIARFYSKGNFKFVALGDYKSEADIARFIGAPPGYVGFEEGGGIVNWLLANPRSVMLFDEVEKAHPKVLDIFLQLFDQGWLEDAHHRTGRANQALFIMTSNVGHEAIEAGLGQGSPFETIAEDTLAAIRADRTEHGALRFRPEFLNRFSRLLVFRPLTEECYRQIALNEIGRVVKEHRESSSKLLEPAENDWSELTDVIGRYCRDNVRHARAAKEWLVKNIVAPVSKVIVPAGTTARISIAIEGMDFERQVVVYGPDGQALHTVKESSFS